VTDDVFGGHDDDVVVSLGRDELDSALQMRERPVNQRAAPPDRATIRLPAKLGTPGLTEDSGNRLLFGGENVDAHHANFASPRPRMLADTRKMKSGRLQRERAEGLTGKADRFLGRGRGDDGNSRDEVSRTSLKRRDVDELTNSRLFEGFTCLERVALLHVATQAHELARCSTRPVSNQSGDQRRATTYVNVRQRTPGGVAPSGGAPATRRGPTPSLAIRTLEFRLGLDTPALRWGGVRSALHVPPAHTAIGQDHSAASKCRIARRVQQGLVERRGVRSWPRAHWRRRGVTNTQRPIGDGAREHSTNVGIHDGDTLAEGEGGHGVRRVLTDPGQSSRSATRWAPAPSNSSRIHYRRVVERFRPTVIAESTPESQAPPTTVRRRTTSASRRLRQLRPRFMTRDVWVCWSMTSLTSTAKDQCRSTAGLARSPGALRRSTRRNAVWSLRPDVATVRTLSFRAELSLQNHHLRRK